MCCGHDERGRQRFARGKIVSLKSVACPTFWKIVARRFFRQFSHSLIRLCFVLLGYDQKYLGVLYKILFYFYCTVLRFFPLLYVCSSAPPFAGKQHLTQEVECCIALVSCTSFSFAPSVLLWRLQRAFSCINKLVTASFWITASKRRTYWLSYSGYSLV